jgi:hypothetical protein
MSLMISKFNEPYQEGSISSMNTTRFIPATWCEIISPSFHIQSSNLQSSLLIAPQLLSWSIRRTNCNPLEEYGTLIWLETIRSFINFSTLLEISASCWKKKIIFFYSRTKERIWPTSLYIFENSRKPTSIDIIFINLPI